MNQKINQAIGLLFHFKVCQLENQLSFNQLINNGVFIRKFGLSFDTVR